MKIKIKIWQISFLILAVIIIFRFDLLLGSWALLFTYLKLMLSDFNLAWSQLDLELFDHILSSKLLTFLPIIIIFFRNKTPLCKSVSFSLVGLILILTAFLFAPYLTDTNPNFQKDLRVTRLLSPISTVYAVKKIENKKNNKEIIDIFLNKRKNIIEQRTDENYHYADSILHEGNSLIYFQKNRRESIEKSGVIIDKKYFLLGTDEYGRDVFSRLIYGVRVSLLVGLMATVISFILGLSMGFISGFSGGVIDSFLNRFTETFLAFPIIFLIILILALFGNSILWVILVLGFSGWMSLFKIVRGEVLQIKNKDFFISAKMLGLKKKDLMIKEVLPVILAPLVVNLVFQYGNVILAESTLSYLGLGAGDQYPSWGKMIEQGQAYIGRAWWLILFPGLALILTLFTANRIGQDINKEINPNLKNG